MEGTQENRYLSANNLLMVINELRDRRAELELRNNSMVPFDVEEWEIIKDVAGKYNMTQNELIMSLVYCCNSSIKQIEKIDKRSKNKHIETIKGLKENIYKMFALVYGGSYSDDLDMLFGEGTLLRLEAAIDFINDELDMEDVDMEKISEFAQQIQELIGDVKQSSLDGELKNLILAELCGVSDMLTKYMVLGMEAVYESVKSTVGLLMMNYRENFTEDEKGIMRKILCLMSTFNTEFGFVKNIGMLTSAALKFLE